MPVQGKKDRMISFRLSSEEYELAAEVCRDAGVRTVSALAQLTLMAACDAGVSDQSVSRRRLTRMEAQIKNALKRIGDLEKRRSARTTR